MKGFRNHGKQVFDADGQHFGDMASPLAAILVCVALNHRNHRPTINADEVVCSRCQSRLPDEAHERCVPRTPRCRETPDLFGDEGNNVTTDKGLQQVRAAVHSRT